MHMSPFFLCKNGHERFSWSSVCDGFQHCSDGSDEEKCHCHGDIYECFQGNNVSCRLACRTYGRVTCLTYQNTRACEQFLQDVEISSIDHQQVSYLSFDQFDALRYSAGLAIGILLCASILSILIYFIRKYPSFSFSYTCTKRPVSRFSALQQTSTSNISVTRYTTPPDVNHLPVHSYSSEFDQPPPPYPDQSRSDSILYETIKTPSISSSRTTFSNRFMQTHCV